MLKKYPYILLFFIVLLSTFRVSGQMAMPDNVCVGQPKHYNVDPNPIPGSTYTWWVDGVVQAWFTSNIFDHTWDTPNTYLLEVQELSADGCLGPKRSGQVFVNPAPILAATGNNPATCGANGRIDFTFTNVPNGLYSITYDAGSFTNVNVNGGTASVPAPAGAYNNLEITAGGCTSAAGTVVVIQPGSMTGSAAITIPIPCSGGT